MSEGGGRNWEQFLGEVGDGDYVRGPFDELEWLKQNCLACRARDGELVCKRVNTLYRNARDRWEAGLDWTCSAKR